MSVSSRSEACASGTVLATKAILSYRLGLLMNSRLVAGAHKDFVASSIHPYGPCRGRRRGFRAKQSKRRGPPAAIARFRMGLRLVPPDDTVDMSQFQARRAANDAVACEPHGLPAWSRGGRETTAGRKPMKRIAMPALRTLALLVPLCAMVAIACADEAAPETPAAAAPAAQKGGGGRAANAPSSAAAAEQHKLPPDSTTKQTLDLPGRKLAFTATAGSIRLFDDKGEPQADIATIAYQLDGADRTSRPVTFVFNGGPGASSAWLQLGNNGPWRLDINADAVTPSTSPELRPNAETWLDFTDLVFIDPVGTGYSRFVASGEEARKRFYSVDGDVGSIAVTIRRWLEKNDRLLSPKYIAGESYGGIRGPKVVRNLQIQQGIGVSGLILLSPVFDFREFSGSSLLQYVWSLPSYAAVARQREGKNVTRADMKAVETYARTDFLTDLLKGQADTEATNRLADKVAALTGIDQTVSRRLAGRFDVAEFRREFDRRNGK